MSVEPAGGGGVGLGGAVTTGGVDALGGVVDDGGVVAIAMAALSALMTILPVFRTEAVKFPGRDASYLTKIRNLAVRRAHCRYP